MPVSGNVKVIHDGQRNAVVQLLGGAIETNAIKVDVATLNPRCRNVSVKKITYDAKNCGLTLSWDGLAATPFANLFRQGKLNYGRISALKNGGDGGATGNILLSCAPQGTDTPAYTVILELIKKY